MNHGHHGATWRPRRLVGAALSAMVAAAVLTGCSGGNETVTNAQDAPAVSSPPSQGSTAAGGDGESPAASDSSESAAGLPPGDPGTDAPGTDDPNADLGGDPGDEHGSEPARTSVPLAALLDGSTVSSVAGPGWRLDAVGSGTAAAPPARCAVPGAPGAVATRTVSYRRADGAGGTDRLVETVTTHPGHDAAKQAVTDLGSLLGRCSENRPTDPRVGEASVEASITDARGRATHVTALAAEGVVVVLSGTGRAAEDPDVWAALVDIAQGNSCAAAADGCH